MIPLFKVYMSARAKERVDQVLDSGYLGQGRRVEEFEAAFQEAVGAPAVRPLSLNSCTAALDLALHLCGVGPGSEVITTPMTCMATNVHIVHRGARIVWGDVDPKTGLLDPEDVAQKLTPRTRAILAVDWAGQPCDYAALKQFGIPVIEDAAHALLARYEGESVARSGGDYVCWSFQAIKHLTTGDGGALLVPADQYERAKLLRWYGLDRTKGESFRCSQDIAEVGYKYHMNDVAAAIGIANLPDIQWIVGEHRKNARFYSACIANPKVEVPAFEGYGRHRSSWWLYTLILPSQAERERFVQDMAKCGIMSSPVHARNDKHSSLKEYVQASLPGTAAFSEREAAIPVGWWLTPEEREQIAAAVSEWR